MPRFSVPSGPRRYSTTYARFRGVDFSTDPALVDASRSPFAPNLISDAGGMPEKRPGWRTLAQLQGPINGLHDWEYRGKPTVVIHNGKSLHLWEQGATEPKFFYEGLTNARSQSFVLDGKLYLLTGERFLCMYDDGEKLRMKPVRESAYVPLTSIGCKPYGGGTSYEACNMLTNRRKNGFCCDGTSKNYYLDVGGLTDELVSCTINGKTVGGFAVDRPQGILVFETPPPKPEVPGRDNLEVTFSAGKSRAAEIEACPVCGLYGGCVFLGGSASKPAFDYRSGYGDPTYFPDVNYSRVGEESPILGYLRVGPYQAVIKRSARQEATIFLRQESQMNGETVFPIKQGISGVGAVSANAFANLRDEPLFLSEQGVFAICSSNVGEEKSVQNRSHYIDAALRQEKDLSTAVATQWRGWYLLAVGGRCYLLDGTQEKSWRSQSMGDYLYECYHWENVPATCLLARGDDLFFGTADGRFCRFNTDLEHMNRYSDDGAPIVCAWSTKADDDGSFTRYKTMERRGSGVLIKPYLRSSVKVNIRTDKDVGQPWSYATMDIFDWDDLDFNRIGFATNDWPQVVPFSKRAPRYLTLQITVKNDGLNEGFGVYGISKCFAKDGQVK